MAGKHCTATCSAQAPRPAPTPFLFAFDEADPVAYERDRARVRIRRDIEQKLFSVRGHVVINHAGTKNSQSGPESKKPFGCANFEAFSFLRDLRRHHLVSIIHKIKFPAVAPPSRPAPAVGGHLPFSAAAFE